MNRSATGLFAGNDINVKCAFCKAIFPGLKYIKHLREDHENEVKEQWHSCSNCTRSFPNKFKLETHSLISHPVDNIKCQVCPFTFKNFMIYLRHFQNDHNEFKMKEVHYCKLCKLNCIAFQSRIHWRFHMVTKHSQHVADTWQLCKSCIDERFENEHDLEDHLKKYHDETDENDVTAHEIFENPHSAANKPFKCSVCLGMSFETEQDLLLHFKIYHGDIRFSCYKCSRKFQSHSVLFTHLKDGHDENEPQYHQIALTLFKNPEQVIGYLKPSPTDIPMYSPTPIVLTSTKTNIIHTHKPPPGLRPILPKTNALIISGANNQILNMSSPTALTFVPTIEIVPPIKPSASGVQCNISRSQSSTSESEDDSSGDEIIEVLGDDQNDEEPTFITGNTNEIVYETVADFEDIDGTQTEDIIAVADTNGGNYEDIVISDDNAGDQQSRGDLILVCDDCLEVFTSRADLNAHMEEKHLTNPKITVEKEPPPLLEKYHNITKPCRYIDKIRFSCVICYGVIYGDEVSLHFSRNHKDFCIIKKWPFCEKCGHFFQNQDEIDQHDEKVHQYAEILARNSESVIFPSSSGIQREIIDLEAPPPTKKLRLINNGIMVTSQNFIPSAKRNLKLVGIANQIANGGHKIMPKFTPSRPIMVQKLPPKQPPKPPANTKGSGGMVKLTFPFSR